MKNYLKVQKTEAPRPTFNILNGELQVCRVVMDTTETESGAFDRARELARVIELGMEEKIWVTREPEGGFKPCSEDPLTQKALLYDFVTQVRNTLLLNANKWPSNWDGHELRELAYLAFKYQRPYIFRDRRSKRTKDFNNEILVRNLP